MATNTLQNVLCITLNLFRNLRLRIAIVRSAKHFQAYNLLKKVKAPGYLTAPFLNEN